MIPLGAKVSIKDVPNVEGRVMLRYDYLNGSTHYEVQWWSEKSEQMVAVRVHEPELTILDDSEAVDTPIPDERFALGMPVKVVTDLGRVRYVTAHYISISGCVEYELFGEGLLSSGRKVLEPELLVPLDIDAEKDESESLEVGEQTGSYARQVYSSR